MANIKISIINRSTVVKDGDVTPVVHALQKQVRQDFSPIWGVDADLFVVPKGQQPAPGSWWLVILDNSDQAGALGYHDLTSEGLPLGKIFAKTVAQYGDSWTVTASHELLEMLGDPDINLTAFVQNGASSGRLYAYEVCDACEKDSDGYLIDGIRVSDFVYPAWFESFRKKGSTQFNHGKTIHQPFELLPGGYIGIFDVGSGSGWQQLTAEKDRHYRARPKVGSRRERRRTHRDHWLISRPEE